jgi:hypothetical protein
MQSAQEEDDASALVQEWRHVTAAIVLPHPKRGQSGLRLPPGILSASLVQSNRRTRSAQWPLRPRKPPNGLGGSPQVVVSASKKSHRKRGAHLDTQAHRYWI